MDIQFVWAMILLLGVGTFIGIMRRKQKMTAGKFAFIAVAYLSFFVISAFHADDAPLSPGAMRFEITLVFGIWILGYPIARWFYRQWYSQDH